MKMHFFFLHTSSALWCDQAGYRRSVTDGDSESETVTSESRSRWPSDCDSGSRVVVGLTTSHGTTTTTTTSSSSSSLVVEVLLLR